MIWVQAATFAVGFALLVWLIASLGLGQTLETVGQIGWGFFWIAAISGARHLVRAFCLYLAISGEPRTGFLNVLEARLAGEAVNLLTFTGPFLGDATKIALLKRQQSLEHSAAAVIVDDILYYVTVGLMILAGIALLAVDIGVGDKALWYTLAIVVGLVLAMLIGLAMVLKFDIKPVSFVLKRLDRYGLLPGIVSSWRPRLREIEIMVLAVYFERPGIFYALLGLGIFTHVLSVIEVYAALYLLGAVPTAANAFVIESLTKILNFAFSFVPGTIGVYEGGNALFLNLLGYSTAVGVALALVRRGAMLFWTAFGMLVLARRTAAYGKREIAKRLEADV